MSSIQLNDAANLGNAKLAVQGLIDNDIANTLRMYKRQVVKRYRAITPAEFDLCLGMGNLLVSPKIDGELWFLVFAEDGVFLTNPAKLVIAGDFPVLLEAQTIAPNLTPGTIVAGELYAKGGAGRPRVGDLAAAMGGGKSATIDKIGFTAFDLVMGGDCEINVLTASSYSSRLEMLRRHFSSGKRLQAIKTENICDRAGLEMLWSEWVENGNGEGLVARSAQGTIFKIKPDIRLDVVVVAYTETSTAPPMVRSLLLGLMTDAGQVQVIGGCSSIGTDEFRQQLLRQLQAIDTASHYRYASDSGVLYRFVRPEVIAEVRVIDFQTETASGDEIKNTVLHYLDGIWHVLNSVSGITPLHVAWIKQRQDKSANETDARLSQLTELGIYLPGKSMAFEADLPKSELLQRDVWVKETKGKPAVRKLVAWKTHKETIDSDYPAYVVYWADFSPDRAKPLERDVRTASTTEQLEWLISNIISENIKKGWEKIT